MYTSGIKGSQGIFILEASTGNIKRSIEYKDMAVTIDYRHRHMIFGKNIKNPVAYNLYGQLLMGSGTGSHLFNLLIDPNILIPVSPIYSMKSNDAKT